MIPVLLALAVAPAPAFTDDARFTGCARLSEADPAAAQRQAEEWRAEGGGVPARQCLGLALSARGQFGPAADAFTQAAKDAELAEDIRAATLWVLAGNARLAEGQAVPALTALTRALSLAKLDPAQTGEALLDRARAAVAAGDTARARGDIDNALTLVPGDPMAWLLSATLARRTNQGERAAKDIAEAEKRAPGHPAIAYEMGNIAMARGDRAAARAAWTRAAAVKDDPVAEQARAALEANPANAIGP